jgi:Transcriptional regulators of sugar metabolism
MENEAKGAFLDDKEKAIIHLLETQHRISVARLCTLLKMAPSSMRKRLADMEKRGLLIRTHGGAMSIDLHRDDSMSVKMSVNRNAKRAIALKAGESIEPGSTICLGGGTTTLELCYVLSGMSDIVVLTNSISAANILMENNDIEVKVCGGTIRNRIGCIVGPSAGDYFKNIKADKAFLGVDAFSLEKGMSSSNILVGEVERCMAQCSREVVILSDSSKLGKEIVSPFLPLDQVDCLITDSNISNAFLNQAEKIGLKVVRAPASSV